MVRVEDDAEIPESGAVFTFGKSKFSDNIPSKFWIRNDPVRQIACGDEHTIIVTENGRLYVFGSNEWGQLGLGNTKNITKPTNVKSLKQEKVICAAGGRSHTIVATESGKLYTFGGNAEGQLGLGDTVDRLEPTVIEGFEQQISMVTAGSYHSAVVTTSKKLYTFGSNFEGQLGFEDHKNILTPTELQLTVHITYADCGYYHTAVIGDGKLYTFGEKEGGKLGLLDKQLQKGTRKPQCIFSITEKLTAVSCGGNHTAAITECGKLYTFGSGLNGQLGLGTMIMETGSPSLVGALDGQKVVGVVCGESHTASITDQGRLYTFGDGRHGKLGLGNENFSNHFNPVCLTKFTDYFVHQVACGGCHMLVLASKRPTSNIATDIEELYQENTNVSLSARNRRRQKEAQDKDVPLSPLNTPLLENAATSEDNKVEETKYQPTDAEERHPNIVTEVKMQVGDSLELLAPEESQSTKVIEKDVVVSKVSEMTLNAELPSSPIDTTKPDLSVERKNIETVVQVTQDDTADSLDEDDEDDDDMSDEDDKEEISKEINAQNRGAERKDSSLKPEGNLDAPPNGEKNSGNDVSNKKKESFLKKIFSFKKSKSKSDQIVNDKEEKRSLNGDKKTSVSTSATPVSTVEPTSENVTDKQEKEESVVTKLEAESENAQQSSDVKSNVSKIKHTINQSVSIGNTMTIIMNKVKP